MTELHPTKPASASAAEIAAPGATVDPETLVEWMRLVPSQLREFTVPAPTARRFHGIATELAAELTDLGMPSCVREGVTYFDSMDVDNVALHMGLTSIQRRAMQLWRRTLEASSGRSSARYELQFTPRCSRHPEAGAEQMSTLLPATGRQAGPGEKPGRSSMTIARPTIWPRLPRPLSEISDSLGDLRFFLVPAPLRDDIGFARETRLAGCGVAAQLTVDEMRSRDLMARVSFGLLLAVPYATDHLWAEVLVEDTWVSFDPHLLRTLIRHAGLDPQEWPATRSPGAILLRLSAQREALATHHGHPASVAFVARLLGADGRAPRPDDPPGTRRVG